MKVSIWCPYYGQTEDDARSFDVSYVSTAVEVWAEAQDRESADYTIVRGSEAEVMVRYEDGRLETWIVEGETVPSYAAMQKP